MPSTAGLDYRIRQMQLEGPRSPLNCQVLSLHLPHSGQQSRASSQLLSSPVSTFSRPQGSYLNSKSGSSQGYSTSSILHSSRSDRRSPQRHHSKPLTQTSSDTSGEGSRSSRAPFCISNGNTNSLEIHSNNGYPSLQEAPVNMLLPLGSPGTARRAKAHVPSACVNCKRKHLACETRRPCNRCLQAGKEATCVDVQHKKRGRPRLRDEEQGRGVTFGGENSLAHLYPAQSEAPMVQGSDPRNQPRNLSYREIRSQPESLYGISQPQLINPSNPNHPSYQDALPSNHSIPQTSPIALLTLDFVVLRSNYAFSEALSLGYNFQGRPLRDLLISSDRDKLHRLQNSLRAELQDSAHLPPICSTIPGGVFDVSSSTSGYQQRSEYWTFHLPDGQSRGFPISVSLARTTTYFLVLTLLAHAKPVLTTILPTSHPGWNPPVTSLNSLSIHKATPYQSGAQLPSHGPELAPYRRQSSSSHTGSGYSPTNCSASTHTARSSLQSPEMARASLKLPPIRTSGIGESPRRDVERSKGGSVKGSPQSARRMKRRRVEIGEICGK